MDIVIDTFSFEECIVKVNGKPETIVFYTQKLMDSKSLEFFIIANDFTHRILMPILQHVKIKFYQLGHNSLSCSLIALVRPREIYN